MEAVAVTGTRKTALCDLASQLRTIDDHLQDFLDNHPDMKNPCETHLPLELVIGYAHKVSYTSFAPHNYNTGQPVKANPPAPQEEQFRASKLHEHAAKILQAEIDAENKAAEAQAKLIAAKKAEAQRVAAAAAKRKALVGGVPVALPPGMALPAGLVIPAMPAGWK
ncbi:hypothetical protein CYMTET_17284, partial [Cymbomonas tetramitiformis]